MNGTNVGNRYVFLDREGTLTVVRSGARGFRQAHYRGRRANGLPRVSWLYELLINAGWTMYETCEGVRFDDPANFDPMAAVPIEAVPAGSEVIYA
jgi:hypothetical protein